MFILQTSQHLQQQLHQQQSQQTLIPAGVYTPDTYASYADNFDLSLLPNDGEVPLSPQSQFYSVPLIDQQQQTTIIPTITTTGTTDDYIPSTIFHHDSIPTIKFEKDWKLELNCDDDFMNQLATYQYYPSPLPSPPQDQYNQLQVPNSQQSLNYLNIQYPPSPCSSVDFSSGGCSNIKQEVFGNILLPPSPPDSNGAPSPLCNDIKIEPDTDSEVCIDIESLLSNSLDHLSSSDTDSLSSSPSTPSNQHHHHHQHQHNEQPPKKQQIQDHQLLREYLQDTSFQRKHNLKPLALESLIGVGWGTRGDIEPVFSLALEQIRRDVQDTCATLDIPPGKRKFQTSLT